jgi:large subunit ribosomal protein L23
MPAAGETSLKLSPEQVVVRPLITEKGTHQSTRYNAYAFEVSPLATKADVKNAVESLFDVRVLKVRTQTRLGKPRRVRMRLGRTATWRKAIVTLHEDDRIDFF